MSISPGTVTNLDVEPFFVEDWWSAWAKGDFVACKWNDTEDYDWDMRYDKERPNTILDYLANKDSAAFTNVILSFVAQYTVHYILFRGFR